MFRLTPADKSYWAKVRDENLRLFNKMQVIVHVQAWIYKQKKTLFQQV